MLQVRDLTVTLGGATIVDRVSIGVDPGEWVTIIGPNGAGKSTVLRAVGGVLPFQGSITIGGQESAALTRRARARSVASVAQTPVVPAGMSVLEYALLGRTPHVPVLGRESAADLAVVEGVLAQLDLERFAARPLETLSGGEQQRVFLARALAQQAPLLLLDEPTSALDIGHQQDVLELVDELRRENRLTVLATMHDLSIAGEYADRLVLLDEGRVVAEGPPELVLTEELLGRHYRANVRIIPGDHGPLVVPVRRSSNS
ncbi:iron complex transport system ATP-binding protein [Allocatelliglobosispora scoriae]|uniref:Iron complex transport system ATP-binding protein n=1 Tax=Allocatelliglobosispora scoriae TaxID=643052 RepID=A0A841BVK0_9ACTN|nr:ABC transporter ATP-binding protein [Allocatelliglobosispora scoriae]MBB5870771.1 iron complex transport system ATP-binding protein [Allocatelliglobosispora scoriae]